MAFFTNTRLRKVHTKQSLYNQIAHDTFTHFIIKPTRLRNRLHTTLTTNHTKTGRLPVTYHDRT